MPTTELTFDFVAPSRVVFGWGRRREAGGLARSLGRRAFLVCGSRTLESSGAWLWLAGAAAIALDRFVHHPFFDPRLTNWIGLMTHKPATEDYVPLLPWIGVYFWALNYPPETAELNNWVAWYFYIIPISVAVGIVAMLLIRALEKSGLQRVPGSILDPNTD